MAKLKLEMINKIKLNDITILVFVKFYFFLILINLIINHFQKLIYILAAVSGFILFLIKNSAIESEIVKFSKSSRSKFNNSTGIIKKDATEFSEEASESTLDSASLKFDQKSINLLSIKPSLSGLYLVDDELHKIIDLVIRDFVDDWFKSNISSQDEFSNHVRTLIYFSIKQINQCLKQIHWDNFVTNVLAQNLLIQIRIFKKSRERARNFKKSDPGLNNQTYDQQYKNFQALTESNKAKFVECFFDTEADCEKNLCRDNICIDQKEEQDEFLQELSEMLCFCLMPSKTFNCLPLRCLLREIIAHVLLKGSIERLTEPDYINQSILYLSQNFVPSTENFMTTINFCESLDELSELSQKIEKEIMLTRSNDLGGNNVNDIKLQLSSLSYLKRKIDDKISNLVKNAFKAEKESAKDQNETNYQQMIENLRLDAISLESVLRNEDTQHCFIEFMSKNNVQNLISFYLNAEMYRQFAAKELSKADSTDQSLVQSIKNSLRDYSKGLIDTYILNASNFSTNSQDDDDQPVNIVNFAFYKKELSKVLEKLENIDLITETLFDDLQSKIYILMDDRYLSEFKKSSEFHKILIKHDLKLACETEFEELVSLRDVEEPHGFEDETMRSLENDNISMTVDRASLNSFDLCTVDAKNDSADPKYIKINACIISTGRCNELKKTYSIYIMDITKLNESSGKIEYWQTYRRFNDFHDFHLILKKNFPDLNIPQLPGKSFRNSLNDDLVEKRINELNKYLKSITNDEIMKNNPDLLELVLKFLENRRWEYSSPTSFKRRFDSILSPMINSVQTIQTSLKNAPDNVIGIVKGISDNLINESSTSKENALKKTHLTSSQSSLKITDENTNKIQKTKSSENESQILSIDDLKSNNLPFKVIVLLIDEIFDLKEKNQWLRQSLMAIVKSILKNFKGDSMNRKIKEQIAIYLDEQSLARYLKNFRKRIWPQGVLSEAHPARPKGVQELTKLLVKTKILSFVTDDLRHILGNDVTRRGIFTLFDLFQHKALNKRLLYIIMENLIEILFFNSQINSALLPLLYNIPQTSMTNESPSTHSPLDYMLHLHLCRSFRVKTEWKVARFSENRKISACIDSAFLSLGENEQDKNKSRRNSQVPRSKSLYNEIKC